MDLTHRTHFRLCVIDTQQGTSYDKVKVSGMSYNYNCLIKTEGLTKVTDSNESIYMYKNRKRLSACLCHGLSEH